MSISISAKGPAASVKRAAARHGVPLRNVKVYNDRFRSVRGDAPCKSLTRLMHWYGDKSYKPASDKRSGRGAPPGTLLFYSLRDCARDELRGGLAGPSAGKLALYIGAPAALLGAVYLIMRAQADGATPSPGAATPPSFVPTTRSGPGHF